MERKKVWVCEPGEKEERKELQHRFTQHVLGSALASVSSARFARYSFCTCAIAVSN